jgi:outer membrane protein OmpA-like peptidoglycan-associated protein
MADGRRPFLIGAAAGVVMLVVAAPIVAVLWRDAAADRTRILATLAEMNGRLDKTTASLDEMRKAASLAGVTKQLDELNTRIKSTNEALAGVQKASLDNIRDRLDRVEAGVKSGNAALAGLQKGLAPDGVSKQIGQLAANLTALETSLADLKQAISAKAPAAAQAAATAGAPTNGDVVGVLDSIKRGLDEGSASDAKMLAAIGELRQSLKVPLAPAAARTDLVVVHMASPDTTRTAGPASAAAAIAPLSVEFQKIGGTDETAQTAAIVARLKQMLKDRRGCALSVAGYADTLGGDDINLAVSKDRAHTIALKLKEAFGSDVQIAETAWGERRLHELTKDNVPFKSNRRVDIAVQCKS